MRLFDTITKHPKPARLTPLDFGTPPPTESSRSWRLAAASKVAVISLLILAVIPMSAFEAHVVNVTAQIERRPCLQFEVRSKDFWKTHDELWILPQMLGDQVIEEDGNARSIFMNTNPSMRMKLMKQLLALKFNLAYFGAGAAFVPGESTTLSELAVQADALLMDLDAGHGALEIMKNRVESVNVAKTVSTCKPCPPGMQMLEDYFFTINGSTTITAAETLWQKVDAGDHVKATFTLAEGCEDMQISLVAYKAPAHFFTPETSDEQVLYEYDTGFFAGGPHMLDVNIPQCFFQVDFVKGPVIEQLGPEGTDNFYGAQGRLIDYDNGDPDADVCEYELPPAEESFGFQAIPLDVKRQVLGVFRAFDEDATSTNSTSSSQTDEAASPTEEAATSTTENATSTEEHTTSTPKTEEQGNVTTTDGIVPDENEQATSAPKMVEPENSTSTPSTNSGQVKHTTSTEPFIETEDAIILPDPSTSTSIDSTSSLQVDLGQVNDEGFPLQPGEPNASSTTETET